MRINHLRRITVAPGITMDGKDLEKELRQVVVTHYLAGNAVLTRCSESGPGKPKREFWEIETSFRNDDDIRLHYGPEGHPLACFDEALAYLVVLAAKWLVSQGSLKATQRVGEVIHG